MKLENKVAIITGGGTGIGAEIAKLFALNGANVLILGRTESTLMESSKQHKNIDYIVSDINSSESIRKAIEFVKNKYGKLDILVNNAGVAPVTPLKDIDMQEYETTFTTNVKGLVDITKQSLELLLKNRGNVINISSAVAINPLPNMSIYAASKAAVNALTKSWAKEMAKDGVRFNSVIVGPIETPIYDKTSLNNQKIKEHKEKVLKTIPMNHYGLPEDVANVVLFLASDEAKFVTGAEYSVDGGVTA